MWSAQKGVFLILTCFIPLVCCQIRVLQPPYLAQQYPRGTIRGSTAAFGTPYWGEQVLGKLAYANSKGNYYCNETDYDLPPLNDHTDFPANDEERFFPRIVVVRRGGCHFASKVKVAQDTKDASAVIVVDVENSTRNSDDIRSIIMADGSKLVDVLKTGQDVIVELVWDIPNEFIVEVDHWVSPALSSSLNFLASFAGYARALSHRLNFHPHYWIFSLPSDANEMCIDTAGRFCGMAPDWHDPNVTGKQVIEESLRQTCLWETTKSLNLTLQQSGEYSEAWWNYIEKVADRCLRVATNSPNFGSRFTSNCSFALMTELGVDPSRIVACTQTIGTARLAADLFSNAWSPTAMMINEARFSGPLDAFVVARAICTGFVREPNECALLQSRHIHDVLYANESDGYIFGGSYAFHKGGVAWWVYFLSVMGILLMCCGIVAFYRYWLVKRLRNELRYEVFEEVKARVGDFRESSQIALSPLDIQNGQVLR